MASGLAFIVFPGIINQFPVYSTVFGLVFFLSLVVAGLSTLVSICEAYVAAVMDKFHLSRSQAVTYSVGLSAFISILFSTGGGLYFLDAIDYFINNFGLFPRRSRGSCFCRLDYQEGRQTPSPCQRRFRLTNRWLV